MQGTILHVDNLLQGPFLEEGDERLRYIVDAKDICCEAFREIVPECFSSSAEHVR